MDTIGLIENLNWQLAKAVA